MLVDTAKILVRAGDGGDGCLSFRREKYVPRGGPNGGDGGHGGSIIIEAVAGRHTLLDFHYRSHHRAAAGRHGSGGNRRGRDGDDILLGVPVGTVVRDHESHLVLADLDKPGSRVTVARGGRGGRGNARFATSTDQAPRRAEDGRPGEEKTIELELKVLADVGLVGLPNAGKSTLLSRISEARPKIADYPFTTLSPVLGLVSYRDTGGFVVADLPGLIEGAHEGRGLGQQFLRHVERTRLIVLLLDAASDDPASDCRVLVSELESYGRGLAEKPRIVVLNKMDIAAKIVLGDTAVGKEAPLAISAVTGQGLDELKRELWNRLSELDRD